MHYCRNGIAQNNWTPLPDWSTDNLNYFGNGLYSWQFMYEYSTWSGSWQNTQMHVEIASINITHFSLWYMLLNPAGPPIIMADHQIHFCLSQDTDHRTEGNIKSSPILNSCKISKYQHTEIKAGDVASKYYLKIFS